MGCVNKEVCDFCDARCPQYKMDKRLWKELCQEFGKWCNYEEVRNMTYVEGRKYIENMSVWVPM